METSSYSRGKARARETAQQWQNDFPEHESSYAEMAAFQDLLYCLGKRYGLLTEFRENGIL